MSDNPFISVVLPCYNTRDSLLPLYDRLVKVLQPLGIFEIIFVDDGSPQRDWELVQRLCNVDARVKLIKLVRNFGQQTAISAGIASSTGEWVVIMDADLQDRPEEIPCLLEKSNEGYPIVFAKRAQRMDSFMKKAYSKTFHLLFKLLSGITTDNTIGNFGIYNRKVIDSFLDLKESFRGFMLLVSWMGYPYTSIEVQHDPRSIGKSSYTFRTGFLAAVSAFVAFSDKPLKLCTVGGFVLSCFTMIIGFVYLLRALLGYTTLLGWTSLILSVWFLGGITITIIGIVGLYIGKIFEETKHRPHYLIDFTRNISEKP